MGSVYYSKKKFFRIYELQIKYFSNCILRKIPNSRNINYGNLKNIHYMYIII